MLRATRFQIAENHFNPLMTYHTLCPQKNRTPISIADPFIFESRGEKYLFYEVLYLTDSNENLGVINMAVVNKDGNISDLGTVLELDFSISFPIVYKENGNYYMTIHSKYANEVMLFVATKFPTQWVKERNLVKGRFEDPIIFKKNNLFYLFTSSNNEDTHLFYADSISGPYLRHSNSPIVRQNRKIARNAGMIFQVSDKLYRPVQDCEKGYGHQIRLMEILEIDRDSFVERESTSSPVLKPESTSHWRSLRMHTFNIFDMNENGAFKVITDGDNMNSMNSVLKRLPNYDQIDVEVLEK